MANFYRVMWFLLGFLLSAVPMLAFADEYPAVYGHKGQIGYWSGKDRQAYPSAGDACSSIGDYSVGSCAVRESDALMICNCDRNGVNYSSVSQSRFCPYGGYLSGSKCINADPCPEGQTRNPETGECEAPPPPDCGSKGSWSEDAQTCVCQNGYKKNAAGKCEDSECPDFVGTTGWYGTGNNSGTCALGCELSRDAFPGSQCRGIIDMNASTGMRVQCQMGYTGRNCGTGPDTPPGDEEKEPGADPNGTGPGEKESCPEGTYSGTVNGKKVCIAAPPPNDKKDNKEKTTTNPDGSTTTEKTETHVTVNNNTVTTTTTTTTINKNSSGEVTGTDIKQESSTQSKSGYCEVNKNAAVCQGEGGGAFSGQCDAAPTCEGDPLQCAIAKHTFEVQCALTASDEVMQQYQDMVGDGGGGGDGDGEGDGGDLPDLDANLQGGGEGLSDLDVFVKGQRITIPFSRINVYLDVFYWAMISIAYLIGFRIIREG